MNKLVSVIIPCYNAENHIRETILSVIRQSYTNWECLIIDDGSTDDTIYVVKDLIYQDNRINYFYKENGGLSAARNYGLSLAKGSYIQYLDSDDVLFPDKLSTMIRQYDTQDKNGSILPDKTGGNAILFCDYIYGSANDPYQPDNSQFKLFNNFNPGRKIGFKKIYSGWDHTITIPIHCFLFPSEIVRGILFNESLESKEDWFYHLSILDNGRYFVPLAYVGCSYRVSPNSLSKNYTKMIASSIAVLHTWKRNDFTYLYRLSFYFLQTGIYKLSGRDIHIRSILRTFKQQQKHYRAGFIFSSFFLPVAMLLKIGSSIKIRVR